MTGTGISYCIVIPKGSDDLDERLASCQIAPPSDRTDQAGIVTELSENVVCLLQGLMESLRARGLDEELITELADRICSEAKDGFLKKGLGLTNKDLKKLQKAYLQ